MLIYKGAMLFGSPERYLKTSIHNTLVAETPGRAAIPPPRRRCPDGADRSPHRLGGGSQTAATVAAVFPLNEKGKKPQNMGCLAKRQTKKKRKRPTKPNQSKQATVYIIAKKTLGNQINLEHPLQNKLLLNGLFCLFLLVLHGQR